MTSLRASYLWLPAPCPPADRDRGHPAREPPIIGIRLSGVRVPTGVGVCLIGLLGLLSGCGDGPVASMPPGTVPPGSHDRSASERGLLPAAATLDIRLQLSRSHAAAGNPIPGRLIITNSGQTPVNLTSRRYGCRPKYGIVLTSQQVPPNATFTTDCKTGPFLIPRGRSTLPVVVHHLRQLPGPWRAVH